MTTVDFALGVALALLTALPIGSLAEWREWHRPWCDCGSCLYRAQLRALRRRERRLEALYHEMVMGRVERFTLAGILPERWTRP